MKRFSLILILCLLSLVLFQNNTRAAAKLRIGSVWLRNIKGLRVDVPKGKKFAVRCGYDKRRIFIWHDGGHANFKSMKGGFRIHNILYSKDIIPRGNDRYQLGGPNNRWSSLWLAGNVHCSGADLAEIFPVSDSVEPGDVVELDPENEGHLRVCKTEFSRATVGICSTDPGMILGDRGYTPALEVPIAMSGTVPCKVSAENGPIRPGDLLSSSLTPGHAMRVELDSLDKFGTVIGKALESWNKGKGVIRVLVLNM